MLERLDTPLYILNKTIQRAASWPTQLNKHPQGNEIDEDVVCGAGGVYGGEKHTEFWRRNHLTETIWKTCVDGRIVKCTLKKKRERGVHCNHLIQDRGSWLAVVNINEPWISTKCRKFDKLRDVLHFPRFHINELLWLTEWPMHRHLKNDSAPWSCFWYCCHYYTSDKLFNCRSQLLSTSAFSRVSTFVSRWPRVWSPHGYWPGSTSRLRVCRPTPLVWGILN